jgi:hypothetical protein
MYHNSDNSTLLELLLSTTNKHISVYGKDLVIFKNLYYQLKKRHKSLASVMNLTKTY